MRSIYINGVRFNQPFGDTMDWDLISDIAIDKRGISTISQANANCGFPPMTAGGTRSAFMSALEK